MKMIQGTMSDVFLNVESFKRRVDSDTKHLLTDGQHVYQYHGYTTVLMSHSELAVNCETAEESGVDRLTLHSNTTV